MLTVIIPCFRALATINRAVESVLEAPGINVLVIDDACPDASAAHIEENYGHDGRVKVVKHDRNLGLGAARNSGIEHASTEFLAFLDADDYWTGGANIPEACHALKLSAAEVGIMPVVIVTEDYQKITAHPDHEFIAPMVGMELNIRTTPRLSVVPACWSLIYERRFLINNNISFKRRKFEDHDFVLETVLKAKWLLVLASSPLVHYDKTKVGTLSSTPLTGMDHQFFQGHVEHVIELLSVHNNIPEQAKNERACHYIFRLVRQLLDTHNLSSNMILKSYDLIGRLRADKKVSFLLETCEFNSEDTLRFISRRGLVLPALDWALEKPARFVKYMRLLRFARKRTGNKARALARLALRAVSKLCK